MTVEPLKLLLYVAGQGPNSRLAVANLMALREKYLPHGSEIEIVDVFDHPKRALEDGVMLTPMLSAGRGRKIVGNLSETAAVLAALGLESVVK